MEENQWKCFLIVCLPLTSWWTLSFLCLLSIPQSHCLPFKRNHKSPLSVSLQKADWHHSHRVMTFLCPLLRDTGTIFSIPKRKTLLKFTGSIGNRSGESQLFDCRGLEKAARNTLDSSWAAHKSDHNDKFPGSLSFSSSVSVYSCVEWRCYSLSYEQATAVTLRTLPYWNCLWNLSVAFKTLELI